MASASTTKCRHAIARMDESGEWVRLAYFETYKAADAALDRWAEKFPNALVDVVASGL